MLPFLKPKNIAASITMKHEDGKTTPEKEPKQHLVSVAEKIISAIHSKDASALANALEMLEESENE